MTWQKESGRMPLIIEIYKQNKKVEERQKTEKKTEVRFWTDETCSRLNDKVSQKALRANAANDLVWRREGVVIPITRTLCIKKWIIFF